MEKSAKHYWVVYAGEKIEFEGSFSACWKFFVSEYAEYTVAWCTKNAVRVARRS